VFQLKNLITLSACALATASLLTACGGGSSSTPTLTAQTITAAATPASVVAGGTSALSITGGTGTGAVTYAVTTGAASCTVSGSTLTATSTAGSCTVTATKAADTTYAAATSTVSVTVTAAPTYAGTALTTVNEQAILGSGTSAAYGNYANDYTGNSANGWLTDSNATANYYKDESAGMAWAGWYFGQSNPGDHPNYVAVLGLTYTGSAPWGMGYFVKAPANGLAKMQGYTNINFEFWSPSANVGTNPTATIFLNAPSITYNGSACVPKLKTTATIPTAAGTLTTKALSSFTVDNACGNTAAQILQSGISEIHFQLLSANNSLNVAGATGGGGGAANSLNVGRILFN